MLGSQLGVHVFGGVLYVCFSYGVLHTLGSYFTTSYTSWAPSFVFKRGKNPYPQLELKF